MMRMNTVLVFIQQTWKSILLVINRPEARAEYQVGHSDTLTSAPVKGPRSNRATNDDSIMDPCYEYESGRCAGRMICTRISIIVTLHCLNQRFCLDSSKSNC